MMARQTITSDDILGKDAVDPEGEILGVVMKLHVDKAMKKIVGITIDEGFMRPDLFIGIDYVRNFGIDAVFLNRVPAAKFKGLEVITSDGKHVGKVSDVRTLRHKVDEISVRAGDGILSKQKFVVRARDIAEIGEHVILKKGCRVIKLV